MVRITGRYGRANASDMLEHLGLKRSANLPRDGMPERLIQGVRVYVKPTTSTPARRECKHRVIAICDCGQHVPTGRLRQHKCCDHDWQEQPGEPPVDACSKCGETRE